MVVKCSTDERRWQRQSYADSRPFVGTSFWETKASKPLEVLFRSLRPSLSHSNTHHTNGCPVVWNTHYLWRAKSFGQNRSTNRILSMNQLFRFLGFFLLNKNDYHKIWCANSIYIDNIYLQHLLRRILLTALINDGVAKLRYKKGSRNIQTGEFNDVSHYHEWNEQKGFINLSPQARLKSFIFLKKWS